MNNRDSSFNRVHSRRRKRVSVPKLKSWRKKSQDTEFVEMPAILDRRADISYLLQRLMVESTRRYRREQELMLSALHSFGMKTARDHLGAPISQSRSGPTSWLAQQRNKVRPYFQVFTKLTFEHLSSLVRRSVDKPTRVS
jgi:hypothetical protein